MTIARSRTVITLPTISEMMGKYLLREVFECKMAHILCENGLSKAQENVLRDLAAIWIPVQKTARNPIPDARLFHYTMAEYTGYQCFCQRVQRICLYFLVCQAMSSRRATPAFPRTCILASLTPLLAATATPPSG